MALGLVLAAAYLPSDAARGKSMYLVQPRPASVRGLAVGLADATSLWAPAGTAGCGLMDLPEPLLHHVMSLLEPRDLLRLRAVNWALADAARALPCGIFAKLSICLPDSSLEAHWCVRSLVQACRVASCRLLRGFAMSRMQWGLLDQADEAKRRCERSVIRQDVARALQCGIEEDKCRILLTNPLSRRQRS